MANSTCSACPSQCLTCTSATICQSCITNYYLLNNLCLTSCPNGYYPINPEQICSPCNSVNNTAHCDNCLALNVCVNCLFPYYFNSSAKVCVVSCNTNEIILNSTCFSCRSFCSTCQGTVSTCTSCLSGYFLLSSSCVPSCPSPYVPSTTINVCVNCSTSCLTCTNTP
jgi:proprotein convertase subtilisin/kexin type 5